MKKYRLKYADMKGVVTGVVADKLVILGDKDSTDVELNNRYIYELMKGDLSYRNIYDHILRSPPCFYDNIMILERVVDDWPIKLGLVEEIPEEPKRVYMDRYEALRMVYEEGKKVAYDSEAWLQSYEFIKDCCGPVSHNGALFLALDSAYDKKRWYIVEDKPCNNKD